MPQAKSQIRFKTGTPDHADIVIRRPDLPGTGKMPKELQELASSKHLYLHSRSKSAPKLELRPAISGKDFTSWRIPLDEDVSEGLPGQTLEQTTPADIKVKRAQTGLLESLRPDWATLSYLPRPAEPRPVHFLRRRNGRAVVPDFVVGNDNRTVFHPDTWPWFCAGRIDVSVKWPGSSSYESLWLGAGALVGTNVVLTASHVVPWFVGQLGLDTSWKMKFTPAYYDGKSTLGKSVYSYVEKARGYSDHESGDDMAVLKLYTSLGSSLGYFGYKTYSDDWEGGAYWTLIGYPGAVGGAERPTKQSNIVIMDDDSEGDGAELEHNGDTTDGNSGGPLWAWWGDSPYVIGTHSGSEYNWDECNNIAAGGPALSDLIKSARDDW